MYFQSILIEACNNSISKQSVTKNSTLLYNSCN